MMARRTSVALIAMFLALQLLVSCQGYDNKEEGPVMVMVNFQLAHSSEPYRKISAQGGSILTSVVYVVRDETVYDDQLGPINIFDEALLNTSDNTVSLRVPLATPIKLVQQNYNQVLMNVVNKLKL